MKLIIEKARKEEKEIPVCALIAKGDDIISIAVNQKEQDLDVTSHAEILALREASKKLNSYRLEGCSMYVTLEPCPMCSWAIINSRIENLFFGSFDTKYGAMGSVLNLKELSGSKINVLGGVEEEMCNEILSNYFKKMRNEK